VALMTTNHLTPEQIAGGGPTLGGRGWGFGMSVMASGRYGWDGGYGTSWFNDPNQDLVAIALTQTSDFLFNGGAAELAELA
jgi:Beta-lactamase.